MPGVEEKQSNRCIPSAAKVVEPYLGEQRVEVRSESGGLFSSKPSDDRLSEAAMPNAANRAASSVRRGSRPATAWAGDAMRTGLRAYALVDFVLRVRMDRIELARSVEHSHPFDPRQDKDRRRFTRLADVGENALDWATKECLLSVRLLRLRFGRGMAALG